MKNGYEPPLPYGQTARVDWARKLQDELMRRRRFLASAGTISGHLSKGMLSTPKR